MKRRISGVSGRNCRDYQPPPKAEYRLTELGGKMLPIIDVPADSCNLRIILNNRADITAFFWYTQSQETADDSALNQNSAKKRYYMKVW